MDTAVTGVLLLAEQLGGAVAPEEQGPSPVPPALFREVGPLVDDWEKYLRGIAEDMDKQHIDSSTDVSSMSTQQEENIFMQVYYLFITSVQMKLVVQDIKSCHVM